MFIRSAAGAVGAVGGASIASASAAPPSSTPPEPTKPMIPTSVPVDDEKPTTVTPPSGRQFMLAVKYGMVADAAATSVRDTFMLLRELGYDGVEMDSPSTLDLEEVLRAKEESGLAIPGVVDCVHWQKTLGDADARVRAEGVKALRTAIRECAMWGGSSVLLVPGVVNGRMAYDEVYARSQEEIRAVLPEAAEAKITIALENVWNNFLLSPLETARYIDEFKSPWIGMHFDPGNIVNYGWPEQWVRILGKRIVKLDIKEFSRAKRDNEGLWKGFDVPIGEGDCGWPAVVAALKEIGYRGWACAEVGGGDRAVLADIRKRMEKVLGIR